MADLIREFKNYEPLKTNRWVVKMGGVTQEIPEYLFKDFKLESVFIKEDTPRSYRDKNKIKKALRLSLSQYNTVHFLLRPEDAMECDRIKIEFLDPTGVCLNYYDMKVEIEHFEMIGDYSIDGILTNEFSFWVTDIKSIIVEDLDKKTLENYKSRKEQTS